ncbi:MAG: 1,4-dihydroxy-2-naphthoate polyprenyltransferase [Chloroflexota bacterium]|nr:1,4-dihydroxy-2-naphthoate polyprenyltransferase [Chloroflexota bacterium]
MSTWRVWLLAARPPTLPASVVPVLVGTAAGSERGLRIAPFLAALVAALLIQIGTNLVNDVYDYRKKADTLERLGPRRLIQSGVATPGQVFGAACLCFVTAAFIGLYLIAVGGLPILVIGMLSITAGFAYTGGPWPLAYHGLGDLFVFIFFGPIAVLGSAYLQAGSTPATAIVASVPVGLLVTNILVVNNLRDLETDRAAGKRTLAVRLGRGSARLQYSASTLLAFLVPLALGAARNNLWLCLPLLTIPLGLRVIRMVNTQTGPPLNAALKRTGQLHMVFGLLFAIGLWL